MPSGKQVLIDFLSQLAISGPTSDPDGELTDELRACLLLRGSTADDAWPMVEKICWTSQQDDGKVVRQGVALENHSLFLADLLETITDPDEIPSHVAAAYPTLTLEEYSAATDCMWLMLSSLQWYKELSSVEKHDPAERDRMTNSLRYMLLSYRQNPDAFFGRDGG